MMAIGFVLYAIAWVLQHAVDAHLLPPKRFTYPVAVLGMTGTGLMAGSVAIVLWRIFP